jgi:hypothetical protein
MSRRTPSGAPATEQGSPRAAAEAAYAAAVEARFPVIPLGEIEAEVAADIRRLTQPGPGRAGPRSPAPEPEAGL